ncbi:MAG: TlpA family protein disulfide reductase [Polyangiales bacterium]
MASKVKKAAHSQPRGYAGTTIAPQLQRALGRQARAGVCGVLSLLLGWSACGGRQAQSRTVDAANDRPAGTRDAARNAPVRLPLYTHAREAIDVADWHGQPLLLFVFATFDGASQAAVKPLRRLVAEDNAQVLGVLTAQPNARQLLELWTHAIEPNFPTAYDAEQRLRRGGSALGPVRSVPTYIVLDAHGRIAGRHQGYASLRRLRVLWRQVAAK